MESCSLNKYTNYGKYYIDGYRKLCSKQGNKK